MEVVTLGGRSAGRPARRCARTSLRCPEAPLRSTAAPPASGPATCAGGRRRHRRARSHRRRRSSPAAPVRGRLPVLEDDVPADVAVAERREHAEDPGIVRARPRTGSGTTAAGRRPCRGSPASAARTSVREPGVGQEGQPGVIEAVVADEVAVGGDPPGEVRARTRPSGPGGTTSRGRRARRGRRGAGRHARPVAAGRDAPRRRSGRPGTASAPRYFSTPLITMPRVKNRWKTRKITIGMIIVISVPAWMNAWFR